MIDEIIDLPIPHRMNQNIINYLGQQQWYYVNDLDRQFKHTFSEIISDPSIKDSGQAIITYMKNGEYKPDSTLNFFGDLVFSLIQERSKFKIKNVTRLYWNLYTPQSECKLHSDDHNVGKFISAIYNLHTNDGGTLIEDQFAPSKESQAVLFRSEKIHKGITAKNSNFRLNLNMVMEL